MRGRLIKGDHETGGSSHVLKVRKTEHRLIVLLFWSPVMHWGQVHEVQVSAIVTTAPVLSTGSRVLKRRSFWSPLFECTSKGTPLTSYQGQTRTTNTQNKHVFCSAFQRVSNLASTLCSLHQVFMEYERHWTYISTALYNHMPSSPFSYIKRLKAFKLLGVYRPFLCFTMSIFHFTLYNVKHRI